MADGSALAGARLAVVGMADNAWQPAEIVELAVIHIDETRAVEPLERTTGWQTGEVPETFPSGI